MLSYVSVCVFVCVCQYDNFKNIVSNIYGTNTNILKYRIENYKMSYRIFMGLYTNIHGLMNPALHKDKLITFWLNFDEN
jgi:hypothetical protein